MIRYLPKDESYQIFSLETYNKVKAWFDCDEDDDFLSKWSKRDVYSFYKFHDFVKLQIEFIDEFQKFFKVTNYFFQ